VSDCRVKATDALVVAVCSYRGPALGVGEAFEQVLAWADVYHLEQWGPLIGVYADVTVDAAADVAGSAGASVAGSAEISAEAWLPLPPGTRAPRAADPEIRVRALEPERVASCVHRGYPDGVGDALARLLLWVGEQGLTRSSATHSQVYLQAPKGRPGDWEIEVRVPVAAESAAPRPPEPAQG
jgi:DNA gyrase inhibitor GyrI